MNTDPPRGELDLTGYSEWGTPSLLQMEASVVCAKVSEDIQSPQLHEENDVLAVKVAMPHSVM